MAAAAEVAAAGGDVNAVAAAAVAAAAAATAREGIGRSGPRARRQQQQQQQQKPPPPRQPGKLRVKHSHGGSSGGDGGDGGEDADVEEDSNDALAVAADGQRVRLSNNDFKTPVRRPVPNSFAGAASAAPTPAPAPRGGRQVCAPNSGRGLMPMLEVAAGGGASTCGCRPAERFAQTSEMEFPSPATGARSFGPLGESQLARRGDGGDEVKEEDREVRQLRTF